MSALNFIVFEDNYIAQIALQKMIQGIGHTCEHLYESADELLSIANQTVPDVILMDISLNGVKTGLEAVLELRQVADTQVFFLSAHTDPHTINTIESIPNSKLIAKPYTSADIQNAILKYTDQG